MTENKNKKHCFISILNRLFRDSCSMNGVLEFVDTADMNTMGTGEHYMATDVEWDTTGRYFVTSVSWWAHKVDNGYFVWSFQGKILQRHTLDQFCNFSWRPRPSTLLTKKDIDKIKKDLKKYQKQFEIKDRMSQSKASKELIDKRRTLYTEFEEFRSRHKATFEEYKSLRMELREGKCLRIFESVAVIMVLAIVHLL